MIRGDPESREAFDPGSPRTTADTSSGFVKVLGPPDACSACLVGIQAASGRLLARGASGALLACLLVKPPACASAHSVPPDRHTPCRAAHPPDCHPQAMSDAGLRPVVVYHNLSPAELYEKAGDGPCCARR